MKRQDPIEFGLEIGLPSALVASLVLFLARLTFWPAITLFQILLPIIVAGVILWGTVLFDLGTWYLRRRRSRR